MVICINDTATNTKRISILVMREINSRTDTRTYLRGRHKEKERRRTEEESKSRSGVVADKQNVLINR